MSDPAGVSFDSGYFDALTAADERHFWFRARNHVIETLLGQLGRELPTGARVLEVGCGTGNVTRSLVRVFGPERVVAMEPFEGAVEVARRRAGCEVVRGDLAAPPVTGPFGLVAMFDVLEHVEDERAALGAVRGLLAPGGRLLLTVPAHQSLWSSFDEEAGHFRRYEVPQLERTLGESGFRVDYATELFALLFPAMWARRRLGDLARRGASPARAKEAVLAQVRPVPLVNGVAEWLLRREAAFVSRRWRLPVGTSVMALATLREGA